MWMTIKAKIEALSQASHKLAEVMYQQAAQDGQAGPGADAAGSEGRNPGR